MSNPGVNIEYSHGTPAGLALVSDIRSLAKQSLFDMHYMNARTIEIAGIACRSFCKSLLNQTGSLLLSELRKRPGFRINVVMVNPLSEYARVRAHEENNPKLQRDLWESIANVRTFFDIANHGNQEILGSLNIWLNTNPYFSIFRAVHDDYTKSEMYIGPLLRGKMGEHCEWFRGDQRLNHFFNAVGQHFQELYSEGRNLLTCSSEGVEFTPPYDSVCSYPRYFRDSAVALERDAREHSSLKLWSDFNDLMAGSTWIESVEHAVKDVGSAVVIVCPEITDGQRSELEVLKAQPASSRLVALFTCDRNNPGPTWEKDEWQWITSLPCVEDEFLGGRAKVRTLDQLRNLLKP